MLFDSIWLNFAKMLCKYDKLFMNESNISTKQAILRLFSVKLYLFIQTGNSTETNDNNNLFYKKELVLITNYNNGNP